MTRAKTAAEPLLPRTGEWEGPTSGRGLARGAVPVLQVLQQLHGLAGHDDVLQDGPEEGHHGVLPAAGPLLTARARAGIVTHFLFVFCLFRHTVERVGCVPEVSVIYWNVFVSVEIPKNGKRSFFFQNNSMSVLA